MIYVQDLIDRSFCSPTDQQYKLISYLFLSTAASVATEPDYFRFIHSAGDNGKK